MVSLYNVLGRGHSGHASSVLHATGHASMAHLRLLPHPGDAEWSLQPLVHQLHGEGPSGHLAGRETTGRAPHQRSCQSS